MNQNYCLTCFIQYHEQVKVISHDIGKDSNRTGQRKQAYRCIKRHHENKGAGLTLPRLIQLERFYKEKKPGLSKPLDDTSNVSKRWKSLGPKL